MKNSPRLTFDERKTIESLVTTGLTLTGISKQIGRGKNTVVLEVRRNGGREKYNAADAQKRASFENDKRKTKIGNARTNRMARTTSEKFDHVFDKLDGFQMQLDILFEELEQLKKYQG